MKVLFTVFYSTYLIASVGHSSIQAAQLIQLSLITKSVVIAFTGHACWQTPHITQSSIYIFGISEPLNNTGFSGGSGGVGGVGGVGGFGWVGIVGFGIWFDI